MRKIIMKCWMILPIVGILIPMGCQKNFFDQVPDDRITIEEVFNRRQESEEYLANIYARIRDEANQASGSPWLGASDEGDMTWTFGDHGSHQMNIGAWDANSSFSQFWGHFYQGIRSASYFMEHIGGNEEILRLPNGEQLIEQYRAEAQFLRAWFYFNLLRQYGPVPIITEIIPPDQPFEEIQLYRNSFDECVEYVVNELNQAAETLPLQHTNTREWGRATQAMCMAVKSRLLLYAASPLFNGNEDYAPMVGDDGKQLISQQYDANKWRLAADAAKEVIDLEVFDLYRAFDQEGNIDPYVSYRDIFLQAWNQEQIFVRPTWNSAEWEYHTSPRFGGGFTAAAVTQTQVDAYFMENGKAIEEEGSGYTEEGFATEATEYTLAGTSNMYVGREPRFYASVTYSGSLWINKEEGDRVVELYRYGNSGMEGSYDYSKTGYLIRKNVSPDSNPRIGRFVTRPYVFIRLGEIYLNYAEALNEVEPGHPDILHYLNLIRERAGIPGLPTGLGQDEMRERIRHERRVELAFETLRYFDTRRWKIAEETDGGPFYGMNVEEGTNLQDPTFYQRTRFENRVFHKHYYLFPIPQSEIDRGQNLVQNLGW